MNRNFGKLTDTNALTYAPNTLYIDGKLVLAPRAEHYAAQGWLPVNDNPAPTPREGYHYEADGWEEREGTIWRVWSDVLNPFLFRAWTPLTVMRGAKAGGFWTTTKTVLEANDALDEFMASQYCAECDQKFEAIRTIIVGQIGEEATSAFFDSLKVERTGTRDELLNEKEI